MDTDSESTNSGFMCNRRRARMDADPIGHWLSAHGCQLSSAWITRPLGLLTTPSYLPRYETTISLSKLRIRPFWVNSQAIQRLSNRGCPKGNNILDSPFACRTGRHTHRPVWFVFSLGLLLRFCRSQERLGEPLKPLELSGFASRSCSRLWSLRLHAVSSLPVSSR